MPDPDQGAAVAHGQLRDPDQGGALVRGQTRDPDQGRAVVRGQLRDPDQGPAALRGHMRDLDQGGAVVRRQGLKTAIGILLTEEHGPEFKRRKMIDIYSSYIKQHIKLLCLRIFNFVN